MCTGSKMCTHIHPYLETSYPIPSTTEPIPYPKLAALYPRPYPKSATVTTQSHEYHLHKVASGKVTIPTCILFNFRCADVVTCEKKQMSQEPFFYFML